MEKIALWFLIFMTYSFLGWLAEVIIDILQYRKLVNRGFLVGPFCPIYGTGALMLIFLLGSVENPVAIFCVSVIGAGTLEYTTSYIMEKIFHVRWWDYSNRPINLNGRICLEALIGFGILGIISIKFFNPALVNFYNSFPPILLYIIAGALLLFMIADIILSLWLIFSVRVTVGTVKKDATDEIAKRVHEVLMQKGKLNRRLVKAFPNQTPSKKSPKPKK